MTYCHCRYPAMFTTTWDTLRIEEIPIVRKDPKLWKQLEELKKTRLHMQQQNQPPQKRPTSSSNRSKTSRKRFSSSDDDDSVTDIESDEIVGMKTARHTNRATSTTVFNRTMEQSHRYAANTNTVPSQPPSFHAFARSFNVYNLLPQDKQYEIAQQLRGSLTMEEVDLCSGKLTRRNVHDQFQLLCQGVDMNIDHAKHRLLSATTTYAFSAFSSVDEITDKLMLKYVNYWYDYVDEAECSFRRLSVRDFTYLMATPSMDESMGRICSICMAQFLRLNKVGKLCPKLYMLNQLPRPHNTAMPQQHRAVSRTITRNMPPRSVPTRKKSSNTATAQQRQRTSNNHLQQERSSSTAATASRDPTGSKIGMRVAWDYRFPPMPSPPPGIKIVYGDNMSENPDDWYKR
ncbi:hypothetical protein EAI_05235 [Harpegnathos saltator]|uniref:Uncharacterized protein n=1 Tax=Harpegnathos saltator TaxID=610380 RepID=E2C9S0_HARSA|nr:hypothetical protein EAI_05235 [Harpegnathos saltator]